jgi:hypothetical protein
MRFDLPQLRTPEVKHLLNSHTGHGSLLPQIRSELGHQHVQL